MLHTSATLALEAVTDLVPLALKVSALLGLFVGPLVLLARAAGI